MSVEIERFKKIAREVSNRSRVVISRPDLTQAAVLVPIVFRQHEPHLILTKRTMSVATHKGQVSFPGGAREPMDQGSVANALREAQEEIGLDPDLVDVAGKLDDFTTLTNFIVTPVVGFVSAGAKFEIDPVEVDELFEVSVERLRESTVHDLVTAEYQGKTYQYHTYEVGEHTIWGATAGIIYRFLSAFTKEEAA